MCSAGGAAPPDGGIGVAGGAGGSNFGVAGTAEGGCACQGEISATTPACLTGAGGDANGGQCSRRPRRGGDPALADLAEMAALPWVAMAVLAE